MNNMNQNMERNAYTQNPEHGTPKHSRPRRKNQGFLRRMTALTLSAALFGAVSAGTFYGVSALLPQENSSAATVSAASTGAVLTTLASTSYSSTRYGMDVSDIAAAALPSVVSITNISVQEVQSFFKRFAPTVPVRPSCRRPPAAARASSLPTTAPGCTWSPMPMW